MKPSVLVNLAVNEKNVYYDMSVMYFVILCYFLFLVLLSLRTSIAIVVFKTHFIPLHLLIQNEHDSCCCCCSLISFRFAS